MDRFKKVIKSPFMVLAFSLVITMLAALRTPYDFKSVMQKSEITVRIPKHPITVSNELPVWIKITNDEIITNRALNQAEVYELKNLVSDSCSWRTEYVQAVQDLAFKSNNSTSNFFDLSLLTLWVVILGCSARTFYDYIGRKCYTKEGQNMAEWWPWYYFRPIICAPITALLIVGVRTSIFSNLFASKDLCTYLVVSFLAGFAIMEFLTMLRRVSKSLFGSEDKKKGKEEDKDDEVQRASQQQKRH